MPQYRWRGVWYFWGGGNLANPRAYERGFGDRVTNGDGNVIRGVRHLNSTIHHAFGYAYVMTGDLTFLKMGDEIFGASFGDGTDTLRNLATIGGKEYDMTFVVGGTSPGAVSAIRRASDRSDEMSVNSANFREVVRKRR